MTRRAAIFTSLCLSAMLAAQTLANQTEPTQTSKPAPRASLIETVKLNIKRLGGRIDETKSTGDMVVSSTVDSQGYKTTIVILNDRQKKLLGFYVYNFGSVKNAPNREELFRYLLATNDAITVGGFFVDGEDDIGYKYLVSNTSALSQVQFDTIYKTMASVAKERRAGIRKLLGGATDK